MKRLIFLLGALVLAVLLLTGCTTTPKGTQVSGKTEDGTKLNVDQLVKIQASPSVRMVEIANRWWVLYYAGTGENWDLASFELDETEEAMDSIMITNPDLKDDLDAFLNAQKDQLENAIKSKNVSDFKKAFDNSVKGCNSCHVEEKVDFVKWHLPSQQPPYLTTTPVK